MRRIPLTQGQFALVDDIDFKWLSQWKWFAMKENGNDSAYYAVRSVNRTQREHTVRMHREILGLKKGDGKQTDHKNGNRLDNRRSNLRLCTHAQNQYNQIPRKGSSRYKGVYRTNKSRKWHARIKYSLKGIHIGSFDNEIKAAEAYDEAALKYYGEFARLNFPKTVTLI